MNLTERLATLRPYWVGQTRLIEVLKKTGQPSRTLLHAGPPLKDAVPIPIRNSLVQATLFEGWAKTEEEAIELIDRGNITICPAQDLDCVVPLAGVISPSTGLHVITAEGVNTPSYAAINEGIQHCTRVGVMDAALVSHHRWLNGLFHDWLHQVLQSIGGIELFPILATSLQAGDDGHSRTIAGSKEITKILAASVVPDTCSAVAFLDDCPSFALNLWMAACALVERAAEGNESTLITRVGGNGIDFGFQTANNPGKWITFKATPPQGPRLQGCESHTVLGAIGDSAVVDFFGIGGQVLSSEHLTAQALGNFLPKDYQGRSEVLGSYLHPLLKIPSGISSTAITHKNVAPLVLLGMIAADGKHGRIGGGVYNPAPANFDQQ